MEVNKLYLSDCQALIREMPDNFLNLIITSPPYNISRSYSNYNDNQEREAFLSWMVAILTQVEPKMKSKGLILLNFSYSKNDPLLPYSLITEIDKSTPFTIVDTIIWKKPNCTPNSTNRLRRYCEFVFVISRKTEIELFKLNSNRYGNYIEATNNDRIARRWNSQPYSTELVLKLLKMYGRKTDLVFDPFSGIGTTIRACCIFGCRWIGSELDWRQANYFNNKRLEAVMNKIEILREEYKDVLT